MNSLELSATTCNTSTCIQMACNHRSTNDILNGKMLIDGLQMVFAWETS